MYLAARDRKPNGDEDSGGEWRQVMLLNRDAPLPVKPFELKEGTKYMPEMAILVSKGTGSEPGLSILKKLNPTTKKTVPADLSFKIRANVGMNVEMEL
jgi:hypothetical protein